MKFNINELLLSAIRDKIEVKGVANILLFDTETTGLINPVEITQFGYIVVAVSIKDDLFSYSIVEEVEKNFYVSKQVETKAGVITNIVRVEDLNNVEYMSLLSEEFKAAKIKMDKNTFTILNPSDGLFTASYYEDVISSREIDFVSGHNLYEYDILKVLTRTYSVVVDPLTVLDTLLFGIHAGLVKTKRGRSLNNEVKKILAKVEDKENMEKLMLERETHHGALLDIKVNLELLKFQLNTMYKLGVVEKAESVLELVEQRPYTEGDWAYLRTDMTEGVILKADEIVKFAVENKFEKVIIVDRSLTNSIKNKNLFEKKNISVIFGVQVTNKDSGVWYDIVFSSTLDYRLVLPMINDYKINNFGIEMIKKYTKCLVVESEKMQAPKMLTADGIMSSFVFENVKENKAFTIQSMRAFEKNKFKDESLKSGKYTDSDKQDYLRSNLDGCSMVDFAFYSNLGLSAFPKIIVLDDAVDEEPRDLEGYIVALLNLVERKWVSKRMDEIIEISGGSVLDYKQRIDEEISVLRTLGDPDYVKYFFLVSKIGEMVSFGPGRGSAAGSLIAFILGITDTNPITNDLLFERFMDPERPDYPDIDLDIIDKDFAFNILGDYFNRVVPRTMNYNEAPFDIYPSEILDNYIKGTSDFVGKINAVSYSTRKTILGSFLRLTAFPKNILDTVSREFDERISISTNILNSSVKSELLENHNLDFYVALEENTYKLFTNYGIHAGGVIFYPYNSSVIGLTNSHGVSVFDKNFIEDLRMIKMDLLGLNTRAIIQDLESEVARLYGASALYKNNFSSLSDDEVMAGLASGFTSMTFQVESHGMKRILEKLAPLTFEDLVAAIALFRPGPLGSGAVEDYISSAIKEKQVKYNIQKIRESEFKKIDEKAYDLMAKKIRRSFSMDFSEVVVTDVVIKNLVTHVPYFESEKFMSPLKQYYEGFQGENAIYDQLIAERNCSSAEAFVDAVVSLENEIKANPVYKELTAATYGTMVYQEQIMKISVSMANFTKGGSNKLRKAIAKKNQDMLPKLAEQFVAGTTSSSIKKIRFVENERLKKYEVTRTFDNNISILNMETENTTIVLAFINAEGDIEATKSTDASHLKFIEMFNSAERTFEYAPANYTNLQAKFLWDKIEKFGEYAFNKSHAASYSILTYITQYYKEKFPVITYAYYLKHVSEKHKMSLVKEIKTRGIELELQKLNVSLSMDYKYNQDEKVIYIPLTYIKSVGENLVLPIIELFADYNIETLEELIILMGCSIKKTLIENLGIMGIFEASNGVDNIFSYISAKEWFHLYEEKDEKSKPILVKNILEKALKSVGEKKILTKIYKDFDIDKSESDWLLLVSNYQIMEQLRKLKILSKELSNYGDQEDIEEVDEEEDVDADVSFYQEMIKAKSVLAKSIEKEKEKLGEVMVSKIEKAIEMNEYDFYKCGEYVELYARFVKHTGRLVKEKATEMRQEVEKEYLANGVEQLLKNILETEKKQGRLLSVDERDEVYVKKLKEGNFEDSKVGELGALPEEAYVDMNNGEEEIFFNNFYKVSDGVFNRRNAINIVIVTDALPNVEKNGYCSDNGFGSQTLDMFDDIISSVPPRKRENFKLAWVSVFDKTEKELAEIKLEMSEKDFESYKKERREKTVLKLLRSNISVIIIAGGKDSDIKREFLMKREKGFNPSAGETHTIFYRERGVDGSKKKKVGFVPKLFPYKSLVEQRYMEAGQEILDTVFDGSVKFTTVERKRFKKK